MQWMKGGGMMQACKRFLPMMARPAVPGAVHDRKALVVMLSSIGLPDPEWANIVLSSTCPLYAQILV